MPAQAGIQAGYCKCGGMDCRLHGNDKSPEMGMNFRGAAIAAAFGWCQNDCANESRK
jgi:hypothetical protein